MSAGEKVGRRYALQLLCAQDKEASNTMDTMQGFMEPEAAPQEIAFADMLCACAASQREHIDGLIAEASINWRVERMSWVDRNILRIAAAELIACPESPTARIIDQAIELAKYFGAENSSAFVNGVVDKLARAIRPSKAN